MSSFSKLEALTPFTGFGFKVRAKNLNDLEYLRLRKYVTVVYQDHARLLASTANRLQFGYLKGPSE